MGTLFIVFSFPYLEFVMMSSHGHHHYVSTEIVNGTLNIVFHHDSPTDHKIDTRYAQSLEHQSNQHRAGESDHVISISNSNVCTISSTSKTAIKLPPLATSTLIVAAFLNHLEDRTLQKIPSVSVREATTPVVFQTTVLLI